LKNAETEAKKSHSRPSAKSLFRLEQITARATRIAEKGWLFQPMPDVLLFDLFTDLEPAVDNLLTHNIVYIGITTLDGPKGELEFCRWALQLSEDLTPAITRADGIPMKKKEDLDRIGFKFNVLAEHSFAFNMRRIETLLHTAFFHRQNRCWRHRGAGSYWTSDRELNVSSKYQTPLANCLTPLLSDPAGRNEDHQTFRRLRSIVHHI
jgi:hypothetical protein